MLVRFTSSTSGEMVMFAQHTRELFEIIGKECTQRGVFLKEQLPEAIALLHGAVDQEKLTEKLARMTKGDEAKAKAQADAAPEMDDEDADCAEEVIALGRRAHPFIHFMELTEKQNGFILWETEGDF
jgi:hypothetical protein